MLANVIIYSDFFNYVFIVKIILPEPF